MHAVRRWPGYVAAVQAAEGYRGGPWLAKVNAFTWPVWLPLDPVFVYCWRDVRSVVSSSMRHGRAGVSRFLWQRTVLAHQAEQRRVKALHGGFDIETPRLLRGDFAQMRAVTDRLGIPFNQEGVERFIERSEEHTSELQSLMRIS